MKKIIAIFCVLIMSLAVLLGGCTKEEVSTVDKYNNLEPTSFEKTSNVIISNGQSDYSIVIPTKASDKVIFAAEELQYFLSESTGVTLPVITDDQVTATDGSGCYLSLGETTIKAAQTDIVTDYAIMGESGPSIDTVGKTVIMCGAADDGTINSAYKFLRYQIGFIAYAYDCIVYDYFDTLYLLDFDYHYVASIEWNTANNLECYGPESVVAQARMYAYSYNNDGGYGLDGRLYGLWCHSTAIVMPRTTYPQYFRNGQLCYTNPEVIEIFTETLIKNYAANPKWPWIMLGGEDNTGTCDCDSCAAQNAKYGQGGVYVRFINAVAEGVEKYYQENNLQNKLMLVGLCYYATAIPPLKTDADGAFIKGEDGKFVPLDSSVVPDADGLVTTGMCYAPIEACFVHAFGEDTCDHNKRITDNFMGWNDLTENFFVYTYGSNWSSFTTMCNNWSFLVGAFDLYEECGVRYLFDECGRDNKIGPLSTMRIYFRNSFAWNPRQDFRGLVSDFCDAYYGPASEMVQEYFYDYMDHYNSLYTRQGKTCQTYSFGITGAKYWPQQTWQKFANILAKGMHAIEMSDYSDQQKEVYKERVYREYFLAKYNEYRYFNSYLTADEKAEMEKLVNEGIKKYGIKVA